MVAIFLAHEDHVKKTILPPNERRSVTEGEPWLSGDLDGSKRLPMDKVV